MGLIKNLFHVSVQVDDYEKTLDFYCNKLGFDQMFELEVKDFREMLHLTDSDHNNEVKWLTYIRIAPEEYLEVFNGIINPPDFELLRTDHSKGSVCHSFALGCDDYSKTAAALEEMGIPVVNGYITDPTGFKIRIVERKGAAQATKEHLFNSLAGASIYANDLEKMSEYVQGMGMIKEAQTETAALFSLGDTGQYLELIRTPVTIDTGDEDMLGHLALQVKNISDVVWEWGNAGVRTCLQPMFRDQPFPVEKGIKGNMAIDGNEIVWAVSAEGNRYELMYQPGDSAQQIFEREHPF